MSIEFWRSGEWTMVYEDGKLICAGDHYLADEWLQERYGVVTVDDPAGVCIPDGHNALKTLDEARAAMEQLEARKEQAAALRRQAEGLIEDAKRLEAGR